MVIKCTIMFLKSKKRASINYKIENIILKLLINLHIMPSDETST